VSQAGLASPAKATTGISGLDTILCGGLPCHWIYLVQGAPGTGKTTLGVQFLLEGVKAGERVLYITLSHSKRELEEIAHSHGWSLEQLPIHEFSAGEAVAYLAAEQTVFHTADVELKETIDAILEVINRVKPERLVFDPIEQVRMLTDSPLRYRKQLLTLKQALTDLACTALFLTGEPAGKGDQELQSLVHGSFELEQHAPDYGEVRRRLKVNKGRGMRYHGGYHSFRIHTGGLEVYPRLETPDTRNDERTGLNVVKSGVGELDAPFGGGLEEGTACLLIGPTGTGKSSLATLYAQAAALRGERSAVFLFDERSETFHRRSRGMGMNLQPHVEAGLMSVQQVNTGELSPGEFTHTVRQAVDEGGVKVVVIDSLTGYLNAMPQETLLIPQLHELLTYLSQQGVLTFLIMAERGVLGSGELEPVDVSYLADAVVLLRHFEAEGQLRRAISVVKKRYGAHESTIRELRMTASGVQVGEPLMMFSGVLTGTPTYEGRAAALLTHHAEPDRD
jgi:circadian clock protein KaiC